MRTPDTPQARPVPVSAALGVGRLRRRPARGQRQMVGDRLLGDLRRRPVWVGCKSVRRGRFRTCDGARAHSIGVGVALERECGRTVRRELAVAYGRAGGAERHRDYSLPAGRGSGSDDGRFGGESVERLGVGGTRGAHFNAPSSLSGRPASEGSTKSEGSTNKRRGK